MRCAVLLGVVVTVVACGSGGGESAVDGGTAGPPDAMVVGAPEVEPDDDAAFLFDPTELRTFELTLSSENMAALDADPVAEQYVEGALHFDGETLDQVGIRYKGSAGAFIGCTATNGFPPSGPKTCIKLSIKVHIDWMDTGRRFHGLKKLQFHSMNKDDSLMRERLGYWLFRQMGVATSRTAPVRLVINGELAGLFLLVEQIDSRFTDARFDDGGDGNVYKEVWPIHADEQVYVDALRSNRDPSTSVARMMAFRDALAGATEADLPDVAAAWTDMDYMANFLAADRATGNDDGIMHWYCNVPLGQGGNPGTCGNHNYYWYEETMRDRLWLLAWDLDLAFAGNPLTALPQPWNEPADSCDPSQLGPFSGLPSSCDDLIRAWASFDDAFEAAAGRLLDGPYSAEQVDAKLAEWEEQMAPAVEEAHAHDSRHLSLQSWRNEIASLQSTIADLRAALDAQVR
jgi:hypothetical protein